MVSKISNQTGNIEIVLTVYNNCDDAQLFWRTKVDASIDKPIPECVGYAIERRRKLKNGQWGKPEILRNRVGFKEVENSDNKDITKPSFIWPFQTFYWTDHGATNGNVIQYRISAVKLPPNGILGESELEVIVDSGWTEAIRISGECSKGISAFFNRGFVISQFISRIMRQKGWDKKKLKDQLKDLEEPVRRFLAGELRTALINLLNEAIANPDLSVYAALYELSDPELIALLKLLKGRAHIVLANGSDKKGDVNIQAREELKNAEVDVKDRILKYKGLGHNKFLVVYDTSTDEALKVWTGSTNWATTGLCTQVNNGILIEDSAIAGIYYEQWKLLEASKDDFPASLVDSNADSPKKAGHVDVWFTRVRNPSTKNVGIGSDLQALKDHVNSANECVLYVMFMPGEEPLQSIMALPENILVKGVVSTLSSQNREKFALNGLAEREYKRRLVQPEGIEKDFSYWLKEITRNEFLFPNKAPGIGHAITHSKMIVIDPHLSSCKVITGSHNFSKSASENNDENFVVVSGNRELAEAYAIACFATYSHYRWRAYISDKFEKNEKVWSHLNDSPVWQSEYMTNEKKKLLDIWCKF